MTKSITMPQLSETMKDGKLLQWNVKVGDTVRAGDMIAEVEADKANMEIEAQEDGTIVELQASPGETVAVGAVLAVFEPGAATGTAGSRGDGKSTAGSAPMISPLVKRTAAQKGIPLEQITGSGPSGEILMQDLDAFMSARDKSSQP